jgi:predicted  nucleic acid-binding Zn-ribbon protein
MTHDEDLRRTNHRQTQAWRHAEDRVATLQQELQEAKARIKELEKELAFVEAHKDNWRGMAELEFETIKRLVASHNARIQEMRAAIDAIRQERANPWRVSGVRVEVSEHLIDALFAAGSQA